MIIVLPSSGLRYHLSKGFFVWTERYTPLANKIAPKLLLFVSLWTLWIYARNFLRRFSFDASDRSF